jgi:integrase
VGDRQRARQAGITVAEVCDWYLKEAEAGRILGRRGRPIKPSTLSSDQSRIDSHVRPLLGKAAVRTLALQDIEALQADIAAGKTARVIAKGEKHPRGGIARGGGGTGSRTLVMLRAILEHATRRGLIESNPARGARRIADAQRRTRLSIDQVRALGNAMREAEADAESPTGLAAIRLVLLTGFRKSEALGLKPEWLLPTGGVDFPDTKAGPQVRPIGKPAVVLLAARAEANDDWIFPAERGDGHYVGLPKVLARVCARAKLKGITAHTLRHSFASVAGDLGFSELTIAGLLGHTAGSVTSGYVHLDTALVTAADRVSGVIADALDGKPAAKVTPIRRETG